MAKKETKYDKFGQPVAEKASAFRKAQEAYANRMDTRGVEAGAAKQTQVNLDAPNRPNYQKIVGTSDPQNVKLPNAQPSVKGLRNTGRNTSGYNVDINGEVTRNTGSGQFEGQGQRNANAQRVNRFVGPPTLEDALPRSQVVDISGRAGTVVGQGGIDPKVTPTIVSSDGGTVTVKQNRINELERIKGAAQAKWRNVIDSASSTVAEKKKALKKLKASLASGDAAAKVGEVGGANVEGLKEGAERGTAARQNLNASEAAFHESAARPASADDVVLKGPAERVGLGQSNDFVGPGQPAPEVPVAPEQPKANRNVFQKIGDVAGKGYDTLRNALPGGGTPTPTDAPPPASKGRVNAGIKAGAGIDLVSMLGNNIAQHGAKEGTLISMQNAGLTIAELADMASAGEFGKLGKVILQGLAETPGRLAANIPTTFAGVAEDHTNLMADAAGGLGFDQASATLRNYGDEFGQFVTDVNDPNYAGDNKFTGLINSFKNGSLDRADEVTDSFRELVGAPQSDNSSEKAARDAEAQALIDQSRAESGQGSSSSTSTDLRTGAQRVVPPSNGSYFINNGAGGSGFEGVADGTGGVAQGEKQFFRDMKPAFPERGLGAARNEIDGRGRFNKDDAFANLAGEFALSRQTADENKQASFDARTNTLRGNSERTAGTASRAANEDRFNQIDEGLNSGDGTTIRNTMTGVFGRFQTMINQGVYDPNAADSMQAANIVTRQAVDAAGIGLAKGVWNSLMPSFLAGGGRGALDFLNGELSINGSVPYEGIKFDDDGTLKARSSDPDTGWIDLGYIEDEDTANFLRQILSVHKNKGQ